MHHLIFKAVSNMLLALRATWPEELNQVRNILRSSMLIFCVLDHRFSSSIVEELLSMMAEDEPDFVNPITYTAQPWLSPFLSAAGGFHKLKMTRIDD
jgi:hypothetical protein